MYAESGQSGSTLLDVRLISGGYEQVLAQKGDADKTLVGWGNNDSRQLGDGAGFTLSTRITYPTPINGAKGFSHFGTGEAHSVGISDGLIYTWGSDNLMGLLGDGTDNNLKTIPTLIQVP